MLYLALYLILHKVSGGHLNPAMSVSVMIREPDNNLKQNAIMLVAMISTQFIGTIAGCFLGMVGHLYNIDKFSTITLLNPKELGIPILCPLILKDEHQIVFCDSGPLSWRIAINEVMASFIFFSVVLAVKYGSSNKDVNVGAIAIGIALLGTSLMSQVFSN